MLTIYTSLWITTHQIFSIIDFSLDPDEQSLHFSSRREYCKSWFIALFPNRQSNLHSKEEEEEKKAQNLALGRLHSKIPFDLIDCNGFASVLFATYGHGKYFFYSFLINYTNIELLRFYTIHHLCCCNKHLLNGLTKKSVFFCFLPANSRIIQIINFKYFEYIFLKFAQNNCKSIETSLMPFPQFMIIFRQFHQILSYSHCIISCTLIW